MSVWSIPLPGSIRNSCAALVEIDAVDILETFFAEHLSEDAGRVAICTAVSRVGAAHTRMVLFKIGQIRFALPNTAIAAYTRAPEAGCHYVAGPALVPARYRAAAVIEEQHSHYIHIAGTRFGIGPCKADGEVIVEDGALAPRIQPNDDPWIVATLTAPPAAGPMTNDE